MSDRTHWNIKVYDHGGCERETIRGLTEMKKTILMRIFEREGVSATAMQYTADGEYNHSSESVHPTQSHIPAGGRDEQ